MKNFDIEQLERKNIYKTPDDFFEKVQMNVLQEVKANPIIPLVADRKNESKTSNKWWYAAATVAAVAFGSVFFINGNNEGTIAQNNDQKLPAKQIVEQVHAQESLKPATENYLTFEDDLKAAEATVQQQNKDQTSPIAKKQPAKAKIVALAQNEEQVEQIIQSLNAEDFDAISQNTEQDVYLDLYN